MNRHPDWPRVIASLPAGLTLAEAVKRLRVKYYTGRLALIRFGYQYDDGRRYGKRFDSRGIDWSQTPTQIVRYLWKNRRKRYSRQRIHVLQKTLGKPSGNADRK